MPYADDIVITATSKGEAVQQLAEWKVAMEKRGLKVNLQKTKLLVTGKKRDTAVESGRFPCGVCGSGVGVNSILCTSCNKWTHKQCSGLRNLNGVVNFVCRACDQRGAGQTLEREDIVLGQGEDEVVPEVQEFCYLGESVTWWTEKVVYGEQLQTCNEDSCSME